MRYKLVCGDCAKVMQRIRDNYIDMVLTSPPYDNLRDYKGYDFDFKNIAKQLFRVLKQGGIMVWIVGDATIEGSETGTSFKQVLYFKEIGFNLHDTMIMLKDGFTYPDTNRYNNVFEFMFILTKGKIKTFNCLQDRKNKHAGLIKTTSAKRQKNGKIEKWKKKYKIKEYGPRYNVWPVKTAHLAGTKDRIAYKHPAIFPETLARDHIISWSNPGDIILDPMAGSGTTLKMALQLKRRCIGIDISKEYCKIAKERIKL